MSAYLTFLFFLTFCLIFFNKYLTYKKFLISETGDEHQKFASKINTPLTGGILIFMSLIYLLDKLEIFFLLFSFYAFYDLSTELFQLIFVILICIFTDIGGYIFGNIFKGPKLTKISPKKTYSGVIGSFLLSLIFTNLFLQFSSNVQNFEFTIKMFLFILLVSFVCQIGDLIISYFKRKSKMKDTGTIIPGHGGILDRIDGVIFALPFSYVLFLNFNF